MTMLLVMSHGRKDCITRAINSIHSNLRGRLDSLVIHSDARDPEFNHWLSQWWGGGVWVNEGEHGFGNSIRNAWGSAVADKTADHVIHWEEDFVLERPVHVSMLKYILDDDNTLSQIALKRQPWNEVEKAAGGIIEQAHESFTEVQNNAYVISKHQNWFTTNPCMYKREIMEIGWPEGAQSEGMFGIKLRDMGYYSAFLGGKFDQPIVEHIGHERTGSGY